MNDTATIAVEPIEARVCRGAEILDRERPGWWREINADRLLMYTCDECLLAQLYGDYWEGLNRLEPPGPEGRVFSQAHGFTLFVIEDHDDDGDSPVWSRLADAWRVEIAARAAGSEEQSS